MTREEAERRGKPVPRTAPVRATPAAPPPPEWLQGEAANEWARIVPELDALGLLAQLDRGVLALYCSSWAMFTAAEAAIGSDLVVSGYRGIKAKNPLLQVRRDAATQCLAFARELLLTPTARLRAAVAPDDDPDPDGILD